MDGNKVVVEEDIGVITEPEGRYLDHFTPTSGKASDLMSKADELFGLLAEHDSLQSIQAIGSDGAAVNKGRYGGAMRLLEQKLGKPLKWIICLLHFELPLPKFDFFDGKTAGPNSFKVLLGQQIQKFMPLPIVPFQPVVEKVRGILHCTCTRN